jgi:translation initiation factor 2 beta subunit (eIF-2beta)/eIF-5
MPKVPLYEQQVERKIGAVPTPVSARPPEAAFGEQVGQAKAQFGKTLENVGTVLAQHVIRMAEQKQEQEVLDLQNKAQTDIQNTLYDQTKDDNGKPNGFLLREMNQADGSVPEFDQVAMKLKKQYVDSVKTPYQQELMGKTLDAHLTATREQIIRHEVTQKDAAYKQTVKTNMESTVAAAAGVADPRDLTPILATAQANYSAAAIRLGIDAKTIDLNNKSYAGQIIKSAVMGNLEVDPKTSAKLLTTFKDAMHPSDFAELQKTVDGKMIHERQLSLWSVARNFRLADGSMDIGRVEKLAYSQPVPAEQKAQLFSFLHSMSAVEDSITKDRKAAIERDFTNKAIEDVNNKIPFEQAVTHVTDYPGDAVETQKRLSTLVELYTGSSNPFDKWLEHQSAEQKLAWEEIQSAADQFKSKKMIDVNGVKRSQKDVFLTEMKTATMGKTADQMHKILKEKLADRPSGHWYVPDDPAWLIDANTRSQNSDLKSKYSPELIAGARAQLNALGQPQTPMNIEKVILTAAALNKKQKKSGATASW